MTLFTYVVNHLTGGTTNVTNDVIELKVTLQGTGKVKKALLVLNTKNTGKYVVASPVIDQFHKFSISITDDQSPTNNVIEVFEVDTYIPSKNSQGGYRLEMELLGQEHWLQKVDTPKQFRFFNAFTVVRDLIDIYRDQITGTNNVIVENHDSDSAGDNELPKWTSNIYEFNLDFIKCYDGLVQVANRLGNSIPAGGSATFWEIYFTSKTGDDTTIELKAFESGSLPTAGNEVTISDSTSVNESPTEGIIDAETGTVIKAWGAQDFGTMPPENSDFHGQVEAFKLHPKHVPGQEYLTGSYVQLGQDATSFSTHHKANTTTSTTPPGAAWDATEVFDFVIPAGYNLWGKNKVDEWKSSGSDPSNTNKGLGCWDSNLVIDDGTFQQTWVHKRSVTDNFDVSYKYGATAAGVYRGLRALVNGTGINGFAGNDSNSTAFSNNTTQYNGNEWLVNLNASNSNRCAVRDEGRVYEKQGGVWVDISGNARENHCFHIANSITNVQGVGGISSDGVGGLYGDNSAVEWEWQYTAFDLIPAGLFTSDGFYKIGAWANFSLPFPENSYNSNTLGELYGNNTDGVNPGKKEPATFDVNNMHLSRFGNVGTNHAQAEDFGPSSGIRAWFKFQWKDFASALALQGNFKMRCFIYDTSDNVWIQDFVIGINDLWEQVSLFWNDFKPYRARIPKSLKNIAPNLFTQKLDIQNKFQFQNIKLIGFQWQEVYDEEGRFSPEGTRAVFGVAAGTGTIRLAIDGFEFMKPLLSVTPPVSSGFLIEPPALQMDQISNKFQLDQAALSQRDIEKFRYRAFEITTPLRLDINPFDTFFLKDSRVVNDDDTRTADTGGIANTIRLVAKRIVIHITKPASGTGHALRTILGVKRII